VYKIQEIFIQLSSFFFISFFLLLYGVSALLFIFFLIVGAFLHNYSSWIMCLLLSSYLLFSSSFLRSSKSGIFFFISHRSYILMLYKYCTSLDKPAHTPSYKPSQTGKIAGPFIDDTGPPGTLYYIEEYTYIIAQCLLVTYRFLCLDQPALWYSFHPGEI